MLCITKISQKSCKKSTSKENGKKATYVVDFCINISPAAKRFCRNVALAQSSSYQKYFLDREVTIRQSNWCKQCQVSLSFSMVLLANNSKWHPTYSPQLCQEIVNDFNLFHLQFICFTKTLLQLNL